jgi:hypothetical protein
MEVLQHAPGLDRPDVILANLHRSDERVQYVGTVPAILLDKQFAVPDREPMIRATAAQYFWFTYPTNLAEQGTRAI